MSDHSHTSPWVAAIATATIALIISAAGYATLKRDVRANTAQNVKAQQEATNNITARIERLEALPSADITNKANIEALTNPLQERIIGLEAQLAAANARIEALEKAPQPAPAAAPVQPAPPVAAPAPTVDAEATKPIVSDVERMMEFKTILASIPKPQTQAEGAAKTINERFAGLITIKKSVPDIYAPLRDATTPAEARAAIATLPLAQQEPFAAWLAGAP